MRLEYISKKKIEGTTINAHGWVHGPLDATNVSCMNELSTSKGYNTPLTLIPIDCDATCS